MLCALGESNGTRWLDWLARFGCRRYYREMTITGHFEFTLIRSACPLSCGTTTTATANRKSAPSRLVCTVKGIYSCRSSVISKHDTARIFSRPPGRDSRAREFAFFFFFFYSRPEGVIARCQFVARMHIGGRPMDYRVNSRGVESANYTAGNGTQKC